MCVTMNKAKWESLPPDVQAVMTTVSADWVVKHGEAWNTADDEGRALVAELGHETITLSPEENQRWQAAVAPVLGFYVEQAEAKGLPGKAFLADLQQRVAAAREAKVNAVNSEQ